MLYTGMITTGSGKAAYKIAADNETYVIDWSDWLPTDQVLDTSTWSVPAGLTVISNGMNGVEAFAVISGGVSGVNYACSNMVSVNGRSRTRSFTLRVTDEVTYESSPAMLALYDRMSLRPFEQQAAQEVTGCPLPIMRQKIFNAALDFCRMSRTWRSDISCGNMAANVSDYIMEMPDDARLCVIQTANRGGVEFPYPSQNGILSKDWKSVTLLRTPTDAEVGKPLTVNVSLQIDTSTATNLPTILERFVNDVAAGAAAACLMMSGVSWSNPQRGQMLQDAFEQAAQAADVSDRMGRTVGALSAQPKRLGFTDTINPNSTFFW